MIAQCMHWEEMKYKSSILETAEVSFPRVKT